MTRSPFENIHFADFAEVELRAIANATPMQKDFMARRQLPMALAERLSQGDHFPNYRATLGRLFAALTWDDKRQCQAEIDRIMRCGDRLKAQRAQMKEQAGLRQ